MSKYSLILTVVLVLFPSAIARAEFDNCLALTKKQTMAELNQVFENKRSMLNDPEIKKKVYRKEISPGKHEYVVLLEADHKPSAQFEGRLSALSNKVKMGAILVGAGMMGTAHYFFGLNANAMVGFTVLTGVSTFVGGYFTNEILLRLAYTPNKIRSYLRTAERVRSSRKNVEAEVSADTEVIVAELRRADQTDSWDVEYAELLRGLGSFEPTSIEVLKAEAATRKLPDGLPSFEVAGQDLRRGTRYKVPDSSTMKGSTLERLTNDRFRKNVLPSLWWYKPTKGSAHDLVVVYDEKGVPIAAMDYVHEAGANSIFNFKFSDQADYLHTEASEKSPKSRDGEMQDFALRDQEVIREAMMRQIPVASGAPVATVEGTLSAFIGSAKYDYFVLRGQNFASKLALEVETQMGTPIYSKETENGAFAVILPKGIPPEAAAGAMIAGFVRLKPSGSKTQIMEVALNEPSLTSAGVVNDLQRAAVR